MHEVIALLQSITERTKRGEQLLDDGIIDIAFDQFIDIRNEAIQVIKLLEGQ